MGMIGKVRCVHGEVGWVPEVLDLPLPKPLFRTDRPKQTGNAAFYREFQHQFSAGG